MTVAEREDWSFVLILVARESSVVVLRKLIVGWNGVCVG